MLKREKILLGLVAATAIAAGGVLLSGPSTPKGPQASAKPGVDSDEMIKSMDQAKLTEAQAYRLSVLAQNATIDPFYGRSSAITQDDPNQPAGEELVYSGYIKVGLKVFAVINGIEYACGDKLADGGYVLQAIEKNAVLLERTDGSSGRKYTKRVPLVEDDADKIRIRVVKQR
ncbi:MAG: hypothetical protein AUJ49_09820 [Desulfovibrionaceae bacterium CG1_02_65_16]|nr:MAG: hypothetical protein AUJ49_09820 [Desulfovibrionaceae bacterium CG1_02_65_16]